MPRVNRKTEYFSHLTEVGQIREATGTHGDTTLSAAAAKDATSLTVTAITNFSDGERLIIDTGELMEVNQVSGTPAGNTINLRSPLARAHASGVVVKEASLIVLGDTTDEGVSLTLGEGDFNSIGAANKRAIVTHLLGHIDQRMGFSIENWVLENILAALGIPESALKGAGTAANPYRIVALADDFATDTEIAWYGKGARKDGRIQEVHAWGGEVDPTALQNLTLARGQVAPIAFSIRPTAGIAFYDYV